MPLAEKWYFRLQSTASRLRLEMDLWALCSPSASWPSYTMWIQVPLTLTALFIWPVVVVELSCGWSIWTLYRILIIIVSLCIITFTYFILFSPATPWALCCPPVHTPCLFFWAKDATWLLSCVEGLLTRNNSCQVLNHGGKYTSYLSPICDCLTFFLWWHKLWASELPKFLNSGPWFLAHIAFCP